MGFSFRPLRSSSLVLTLVSLALAGCPGPSGDPVTLTIQANPTSILADGATTSTITVTGTQGDKPFSGPIIVNTQKGILNDGSASFLGTMTEGVLPPITLTSCDSVAQPTCAGANRIDAQSQTGGGFASVIVQFELDSSETDCEDGIDNDEDGVSDCADSDCFEAVLADNKTCDAAGNVVCAGNDANPESVCGDGIDDDCDGLVDCADSDCDAVACDSTNTAFACVSGACACPGGGVEGATPGDCFDGEDNDCNGLIDDKDTACNLAPCNAAGDRWNDPGTGMECSCVADESTGVGTGEVSCDDGFDNDCDGLPDCLDSECAGKACTDNTGSGLVGLQCDFTAGACACPTDTAGTGTEAVCGDGVDDDCDGLTDCEDDDCNLVSCSNNNEVCISNACSCPGATSETNCSDGIDEDCDGNTDCQDTECAGSSCGTNGQTCASNVCTCPGGTVETSCTGGLDDDCDGLTDCQDADCDAKACGSGLICDFSTTSCITDPGDAVATLTFSSTRVLAESTTQVVVTATVEDLLGVVAGDSVTFTVTQGFIEEAGGGTSFTATTDGSGVATVVWRPGAIPAKDLPIVATVASSNRATTGVIQNIGLAEVKVGIIQYDTMGVRESGYQESNTISFEVLGTDGTATNLIVPNGVPVTFSLNTGLVSLTKTSTVTDLGTAVTTVRSGESATNFELTASATIGTTTRTVTTKSISVIGARPSQEGFTFNCAEKNIGGLLDANQTNSNMDIPVTCDVSLKDRFGNPVGLQTSVTFLREGGSIASPAITAKFGTANVGTTSTTYNSLGQLPFDTTPKPAELSADGSTVISDAEPYWVDVVNNDTLRNPRDGLATIVAVTSGEEEFNGTSYTEGDFLFIDTDGDGVWDEPEPFQDLNNDFVYNSADDTFTDLNGNGVWDAGEDLGDVDGDCNYDPAAESYTDSNSNGAFEPGEQFWDVDGDCTWDAGETYTDTNTNGVYDPGEHFSDANGNCQWDAGDSFLDVGGDGISGNGGAGTADPNENNCAWDPAEPFVDADGSGVWEAAEPFTDTNGNTTYDVAEPFVDANSNGTWDDEEAYVDANTNGMYDLGETFTDANANSVWDPAETFTDSNGNSTYDPAEPYTDLNSNSQWDPAETFTDSNGNGVYDRAEPLVVDVNGDGNYDAPESWLDADGDGAFDPGEPFVDADGDCRYDLPEPFNDYGQDRKPNTSDAGEGNGVYDTHEPFVDTDGDCFRDVGDTFVDLNGNGNYERGGPFVDLAEPFVDANDNSTWDPGEDIIDVNQNGRWDGPNCRWDKSTSIWTQTRILLTGYPSVHGGADPGLSPNGHHRSGFRAWVPATGPAGTCIANASSTNVELAISDMNINLPSGGTTGLSKVSGTVNVKYTDGTASKAIPDAFGMECTAGIDEAGKLITDCNGTSCTCAVSWCTRRTVTRCFSGGASYGVLIEDATKTDKDPAAGYSVNATYNLCSPSCTFGLSGIVD